MKSVKCGFTIAALFLTVTIEAQELVQKVSFSAPGGKPLIEVLEEFAGKTRMRLVYSKADIKELKVKSIKCDNIPVNACLKDITSGLPIVHRLRGDLISIKYQGSDVSALGDGRVSGKIVDEIGNPVISADVSIAGKNAVTDSNGDFSIEIPSGIYTLIVKVPKYNVLRVEKLSIVNNETNTVSFVMRSASDKIASIKEVVITGTRKADTQAGLLALQKKAAQMSDGISAEQISKTPDNDLGGTLKRITGITTIDNKYVVVRSMGERWNTAAMDGINLPSTEAYNQNFSFDIIPNSMVESVIVSKTATPDMNASFAGGFVEVKTKDIPNENFTTVTMGASYNDQTTFKEFLTRKRGKYDYFGYDDGTRDFPMGLKFTNWENPLFFEQSRQFKNDNFTNYATKADMGSNFQIALGRNYKLKNNSKWGFAGALIVRNEQNKLEIDHTGRGNWLDTSYLLSDWQTTGSNPVEFYNFKNQGASYNYNSTVAGMLNFGLQLGKNRFSFRNSYTHIYDNTLTRITGWNEYTSGSGLPANAELAYNYFYNGIVPNNDPEQIKTLDRPYTNNANYPIYQTLLQNKIEGSHKIGNVAVDWFAARTGVASDTKDYTLHNTLYNFIGNEIIAYHEANNSSSDFARGYIENKETDYNYGASFKWGKDLGDFKNDIKAGYAGVSKSNTNFQQKFLLRVDEKVTGSNLMALQGALSEWLDGSHYVPGGIGWQTRPLYTDERYKGKVEQHAGFIMFDNRWKSKFRLVWGLRAEYFKYELISQQLDPNDPQNVYKEAVEDKPWQFMPSANFTYSPTSKTNVRLAYNRMVIRPQFNERTGLPYFDPIANGLIHNTEMVSSVVNNYDFKLEWFPGLGEIFSVGLYYKNIDRPIEREGYISNEGNLHLYNGNSKNAELKGFEAEIRKNLGFITADSFFEKLFISGNFTYNDTKVISFKDRTKTTDLDDTYEVDRPLYGQTPYAYNLGLMYDGERLGISLLYNAKGEQYITVGYGYNGEEIQRPYAVADAQLSYKFLRNRNLEVKFNARNLFNRVKEFYNNFNSYSVSKGGSSQTEREMLELLPGATDKYDKNIDKILFRAYSGRIFGVSVNYTF
ncbi:TonB-dependent receptor domain-containing protein [Chryseobacterium balustinum]|uniref:Outer membrane receptor proteins, mostly Fe transport n=1 Tax=Chryseobacterium balustinum TaxID=246 RepID=A0AAX2ILL3_9FLAO|nr:TonB-dependent receptor [Chryseobacterium balustinum]AZB29372.1 TonB-dependent receptor [Chryseobacterium balustinum]SKC02245.1 Outer membrane receptor proteins, mostly Fe transport [Chryseobacterium balustinum]SQA90661.1 TonB-dependent receptor [Chryseobacterium balustinum]